MDIREVLQIAREIVKTPGIIVSRHKLVCSYGDRLDVEGEKVLGSLLPKLGCELQAVAVLPTLRTLAERKSGKKILIHEISVKGDIPFYGYVENAEDHAVVKIKSDMNMCWKRFTVTKELLHIYANTGDDAPNATAELLVKAARDSRNVFVHDNTELDDETSAFYMALEVLMPWDLREQFALLRERGATHYQIAKTFMLPEPFVDHFVGDGEDSYAALSRRLNQNI